MALFLRPGWSLLRSRLERKGQPSQICSLCARMLRWFFEARTNRLANTKCQRYAACDEALENLRWFNQSRPTKKAPSRPFRCGTTFEERGGRNLNGPVQKRPRASLGVSPPSTQRREKGTMAPRARIPRIWEVPTHEIPRKPWLNARSVEHLDASTPRRLDRNETKFSLLPPYHIPVFYNQLPVLGLTKLCFPRTPLLFFHHDAHARKEYHCSECKKQCASPTYVRLHLTACGHISASKLERWQRSIPVGHFCDECLLRRVRMAVGRDFDSSLVESHSGRAHTSGCVRTEGLWASAEDWR